MMRSGCYGRTLGHIQLAWTGIFLGGRAISNVYLIERVCKVSKFVKPVPDIFFNNCFQNGILPVILKPQQIQVLFDRVDAQKGYQVTIDLSQQTVALLEGDQFHFDIDPFRKDCLLRGLDAIGLTLQHDAAISDYEKRQTKETPWLFQDLLS